MGMDLCGGMEEKKGEKRELCEKRHFWRKVKDRNVSVVE